METGGGAFRALVSERLDSELRRQERSSRQESVDRKGVWRLYIDHGLAIHTKTGDEEEPDYSAEWLLCHE